MLTKMRHWNINLRQQSRSSLISGNFHLKICTNTINVKSSTTASHQAIEQDTKGHQRWIVRLQTAIMTR